MSERSKVAEIQIGTDIYEVQSKSVENQNTAIGAFTDKYDWVGTQAEYQALKDNDEIPDNWVCFITDDINTTTGVLDLTN